MLAIAPELPILSRPSVCAPALRRALVSGMRRVVGQRDHLNRINVFPVPDGDTGSNLAFTLNAVLSGSLSRRSTSVEALLQGVAEDAIDGARGNSGAILAQFLCGVGESVAGVSRLDTVDIARAVRAGAQQARSALAQPREGTILSVIQAFSDALQVPGDDLFGWFGHAVAQARQALANTPNQLAVLRQAGVVDAGAQGFVDLVEGVHAFMLERRVAALVDDDAAMLSEPFAGEHWHDDADPSRPWCSECLIAAEHVDHAGLKAALEALGADSVVVAGGAHRVRLHAHVANPGALFDLAGRFGAVSARKAENMRAQHRAAQRRCDVTIVTDSASDLPEEALERLPLDTVPVRVGFGDEDFLDRISISNAEFYRRLREGDVLPQTSQPPAGDFRRQFELSLSHARQVVYVGLSRQLSGTLQSGELAAQRMGQERITVIDSGQVSCGQALLTMAAAECAAAGGDVQAVRARIAQLAPWTFTFAAAPDVQHAVRGGRIPRWVLPMARWFGLTAIVRMKPTGKLAVAGALFGHKNVPERLARHVVKRLPDAPRWRLMVGHCDAPEQAAELLDALRQRLPLERDWLVETGPAIGAHAGPGTLVVGVQAVIESDSD